MSFAKVKRGELVRVFFGPEHRDGVIEHVTGDGKAHVRLSPGWVTMVDADDVLRLQLTEEERRQFRASVLGVPA